MSESSDRVVCHIDMDAFYCQVEASLNPKLKGVPMVVTQYNPGPGFRVENLTTPEERVDYKGSSFNTIIAVSYEARKLGVRRLGGQSSQDAKKLCPDLVQVQVPVQYHKPNLEIYRSAGARVVNVLKEYLQDANSTTDGTQTKGTKGTRQGAPVLLEKASIDEVYIDITKECESRLNKAMEGSSSNGSGIVDMLTEISTYSALAGADEEEAAMSAADIRRGHSKQSGGKGSNSTHLNSWFHRPLHDWSRKDLLIAAGATVSKDLRAAVYTRLGFTCSGGVAHNKLLSKVASAMHKPNQQTLVPHELVAPLLHNMPLNRVQGFGGILGETLKATMNVKTLGELRAKDIKEISKHFDTVEEAEKILLRAEGADTDPVQSRSQLKSIASSKNFRRDKAFNHKQLTDTTRSNTDLERWLRELCHDLTDRIEAEEHLNSRKPKLFVASMNFIIQDKFGEEYHAPKSHSISRSCGYPTRQRIGQSGNGSESGSGIAGANADACELTEFALMLLRKAVKELKDLSLKNNRVSQLDECHDWKITGLGVTGTNFTDVLTGEAAILNFFKPDNSGTTSPVAQPEQKTTVSPIKPYRPIKQNKTDKERDIEDMLRCKGVDVDCYRSMPEDIQKEIRWEHTKNTATSFTLESFSSTSTSTSSSSVKRRNGGEAVTHINSVFKRRKGGVDVSSDNGGNGNVNGNVTASIDVSVTDTDTATTNATTATRVMASQGLSMAEKMKMKQKDEQRERAVRQFFGNSKCK